MFLAFKTCQNIYKEDEYFSNNGKGASHLPVMVTAGIQLRLDKSIKLNFTFKH